MVDSFYKHKLLEHKSPAPWKSNFQDKFTVENSANNNFYYSVFHAFFKKKEILFLHVFT